MRVSLIRLFRAAFVRVAWREALTPRAADISPRRATSSDDPSRRVCARVRARPFAPIILHSTRLYKTQTQIAEVLGTSQTMYARYERGANELPIHHLITLSKYYGVSTDYLLGLSKER